MEGQFDMVLWFLAALAAGGLTAAFWTKKKQIAYLSTVRRELKKEKQWLRRNEFNAAMVKGRQNLELLLKCVAEYNGIQIDNTAPALANQKGGQDRTYSAGKNSGGKKTGNAAGKRDGRNQSGRNRRGRQSTMTNQQFCRWLGEKGYLDRVAKWELNQIRIIGNKAVHENFDSKDEAWNQYRYLEDILKIFSAQPQPRVERVHSQGIHPGGGKGRKSS